MVVQAAALASITPNWGSCALTYGSRRYGACVTLSAGCRPTLLCGPLRAAMTSTLFTQESLSGGGDLNTESAPPMMGGALSAASPVCCDPDLAGVMGVCQHFAGFPYALLVLCPARVSDRWDHGTLRAEQNTLRQGPSSFLISHAVTTSIKSGLPES